MATILYDLIATQSNISGKYHGGGEYATVVFFELLKRRVSIDCVWDSSKFIREDILNQCKEHDIFLLDIKENSLRSIIETGKYTVYYSALPSFYSWASIQKTKFVGTIHGLRGIEMPIDLYFFQYRLNLKSFLKVSLSTILYKWWKKREYNKYAKLINQPNFSFVTVSKHTKYSMLSHFPQIKACDIKVFYSPLFYNELSRFNCKFDNNKYFLLVSGNRPEKNALRVIKAFDELFSERKEFSSIDVLITGAQAQDIHYHVRNERQFKFLGYVDANMLQNLYANAYCFVYPSLNEGFGYPPLEAMRYGVPVIASPVTSIYEVCGNAALYFNPFSIKEIKARILELVLDYKSLKICKERSLERYKKLHNRQLRDLKLMVDYIIEQSEN